MIDLRTLTKNPILCSIIEQLKHLAFSKGCYKVILDCAEKNVEFYKRCGFQVKELEMVVYAPTAAKL